MRGLALGLLLVCSPAFADTFVGTVTRVHDGDTFSIGKQRIRIFGIDAPELNQQCRADAIYEPGPSPCVACGRSSRDWLAGIILNKEVQCTSRGKSYDRIVAECTVGKIRLGPWMLSNGFAVSYKEFLTRRDLNEYMGAESGAKRGAAGLWSMTFIPPADWRKQKMRLECER